MHSSKKSEQAIFTITANNAVQVLQQHLNFHNPRFLCLHDQQCKLAPNYGLAVPILYSSRIAEYLKNEGPQSVLSFGKGVSFVCGA